MRFRAYIEAHQDELIRDLQGLVRIPSVYQADDSGYPYGRPVQDCLEYALSLAAGLGFDAVNMDNQLGWCEYGAGGEMVAVLGHLDVVPEGDGWSVPPYDGLVRDGRIYGRGTMDDKGPTVAALYALKAVAASGLPLARRVRILFGLNEETGSADMKYYREHGGEIPVMGVTPDGEYPVINGEKGLITETYVCRYQPAGGMRLIEMRGGTAHNIVPAYAMARLACPRDMAEAVCAREAEGVACRLTEDGVLIEAQGVSAHGGTPHEGVNANGRLVLFLAKLPLEGQLGTAIRFLAERIGMETDGASLGVAMADDISGALTNNFGVLLGDGESIEVRLNYRYPVTKRFDMCGPQVQTAFASAGFVRTAAVHKNGLYMPESSELVSRLMKVYRDCTGDTVSRPKSIGGGTYAKMLPNVLAFGPIFPGDEVREHKPDEFMEISRLIDNAAILAEAIYAMAAE